MTVHGTPSRLENPPGRLAEDPVPAQFDATCEGGSGHLAEQIRSIFNSAANSAANYVGGYGNWDLNRHISQVARLGTGSRNPTGPSLTKLQHEVRRARCMLLRLQFSDAFELITLIESALGQLPSSLAPRVRDETQVLRAIGAALQDDNLGALHIASRVLKIRRTARQTETAALAVCRFACWRLRDIDGFYSFPRLRPTGKVLMRGVMAAVFDQCVEAAIELEQLRPLAAKRLALDALEMAETVCRANCAVTGLPASIAAQILYEQGSLEEAQTMIRGRLAIIKSSGVLECAWRAYLVLARIAMHQGRETIAVALLKEAEEVGQRRGWARLVAISLSERVEFMLKLGRVQEAQLYAGQLDRLAERHPKRLGAPDCDIQVYRRQTQARLAFADNPTAETVASLRQLHHEAIGRNDLHSALRLALQLAASVRLVGDEQEADSIFVGALSVGCLAGLYQVFIDGGREMDDLLLRAYVRTQQPGETYRNLVAYIGSVLARRAGRNARNHAPRVSLRAGDALSGREGEILRLVGNGLSNKRIAHALKIAPETVKSHVKRIFVKLEVRTRAEAVSRAAGLGLLRDNRPNST
jgi:ATP/maltotriose-dependent transcriptional regulator MalT